MLIANDVIKISNFVTKIVILLISYKCFARNI